MATKIFESSRKIADQIHTAAIHLLRKLRRIDGESGLNAPRLSALSVIVFGGPIALTELASAEQVRPPTMTRIVDALVNLGLAARSPNPSDGRSTQIRATPAGRKLLLQGRQRRVRALSDRIAALTNRERATLKDAAELLKQILAAM
jgi:DNA-binding MarR family transcriptional regulator